MNGRVYDPQLGRFLSADPFVQDPSNLQALNPYSYVQNNPLSYTDPSGYFLSGLFKAIGHFFSNVWHAIVHAVKSLLSSSIFRSLIQIAVCIATAAPTGGLGCAAISSAITLAAGGTPLQALKAFAFAMVSQAVWTNVGAFLRAEGVAGDLLVKGLVHGTVGGALSVAQGGNFMQGFASNAIGAGTGLVSNSISGGDVYLDTAIVGAAGGVASVLSGGKFAAGFITAAFANMYNKFRLGDKNYLNPWDVGNDAHATLQQSRIADIQGVWGEQWCDNGGGTCFAGRPDLGNQETHELWEIKPDSVGGIINGLRDIAWYLNTSIGVPYTRGGGSIFPEGQPLTLVGEYGLYSYRLAAPGVITYSFDPYNSSVSLSFGAYWGVFYSVGPGSGVAPLVGGRLIPGLGR